MSKKNPFEDLPEEFRALVEQGTGPELREAAAKVGLDQDELMSLKANDQDLIQARATASVAGEVYRDGTKMNKLKMKFIREMLEARGLN